MSEKAASFVDTKSSGGSFVPPAPRPTKRFAYDWRDKLLDPNFDVDRSNGGRSYTAYYNIVCCVCGTGMLSLSSVLAGGGWGALALLIICWWMTMYCSVILIQTLYYGGEKRMLSVNQVATTAFGKWGGYTSFFFNAWILLGTAILYFVLCGSNLNDLCAGTAGEIGHVAWSIIFVVIVGIPFVFMKTMDNLSWTSLLGVAVTLVTTFICVIEAGLDRPNQVDVVRENVVWEGWPGAIAVISFSLGGNVVYPNCEAAMKRPQRWPIVCISGLSTCALLYFMIAIPGYFIYGETAQNPIYNSIPPGVGRIMAIVMVTINVTVSVPIYAGSFALDCENIMGITVEKMGKKKEFMYRALWRTAIMVFCAVIACTVPHFSPLMHLFGAFGYSTTIFIIPVLCYWKLTGFRNKPIYEIAWGCLILLMGIVGLIFGTWDSVVKLIAAYNA
ncbi:transmembrane amino acid transporter protein-domain-containing protein [Zychaea mexicana]|uniref:transmembrane amino acid transporter protein-domain-containing protein n=1 Tax=Zychaea mexicana TaxID=64656 RepID=UPI0022FF23F6|nr:transmembrane amino acid transporter protein-domain-containing protein [Zychaea mexicana]KAI9496305.1 transmembrane amino acid transporter protein-domain-containing protein [Zychaea mexicana]